MPGRGGALFPQAFTVARNAFDGASRRYTEAVAVDDSFEAVLRQVFELVGRGTVLGVEIRSGVVRAGDTVAVPGAHGREQMLEVRSVEYIDGCLPPLPATLVGLVVEGIRPDEVAIGGTIRRRQSA